MSWQQLPEAALLTAMVREAARALSGYRLKADHQFVLDPRGHDLGPKTILGRSAAFDGESLAAWLAEQPAAARHISRRLWLRRVGLPPAPERLEAALVAFAAGLERLPNRPAAPVSRIFMRTPPWLAD